MEYQLCHKLNNEFTMNLKVNWQYIYIGYKGYEEITPQISKKDIVKYGYYLLEEKNYCNDLVAQLVGCSQDDYEFDITLEHLQRLENTYKD